MIEKPNEDYKAERLKRGLTQQDVADALGLHVVTICRREKGEFHVTEESLAAIRSLPAKQANRSEN